MSRSISILHVVHSLEGGGAETQLSILSKIGESVGVSSTTFCIDNGNHDSDRRVISYERKRAIDVGIYRSLKKAIDQIRPDLVHAWLPPVVTVPAMLAARSCGIPVIASYRNAKKIRNLKDFVEYGTMLFLASGIVSNTAVKLCSRPYRWLFDWKQGVVIPNAVVMTDPGDRQSYTGADVLRILFVGRLAKQKNWECLIGSLSHIDPAVPWRLTICGAGPDLDKLTNMLEYLGVQDRVDVLGYRSDIVDIMKQHDMLVLPSWYEGIPNVLYEAFSNKLPAIISDTPSHNDVLKEDNLALKFPPDSPESLAAAVRHLWENEGVAVEMAVNAYRYVSAFKPSYMAKSYYNYYSSLLN